MSFKSTVYKILIASPSDVEAERNAISDEIHDWNNLHSENLRAVLLPVMWETHSTPIQGGRPQKLLNNQIVKDCDVLIGVFWTRLGTPTGVAESGTVEEILEFKKMGKPVMLYFSSRKIKPNELDGDQYKKLLSFKTQCKKEGLIGEFSSIEDFRKKLKRQLLGVVKKIYGKHSDDFVSHPNPQEFENELFLAIAKIEKERMGLGEKR